MKQPFNIDPSATAAFNQLEAFDASEVPDALRGSFKAVVIGGGTGAPVSIRTLLSLGVETSAVVAMADDGGSTGLLREKADVTPPGDIRKCLTAFAGDPSSFDSQLDNLSESHAGSVGGRLRVVPGSHRHL